MPSDSPAAPLDARSEILYEIMSMSESILCLLMIPSMTSSFTLAFGINQLPRWETEKGSDRVG
jgi:hypothetical protein